MNEKNIDNDCPVWRTMQIMGSKWAMLILFHLSKKTYRKSVKKYSMKN